MSWADSPLAHEVSLLVNPMGKTLIPEEDEELLRRIAEIEEAALILRWAEAGFPPWGCHHCRGAEYGPDGVPCPACHGHSDLMEPPERAAAFKLAIETNIRAVASGLILALRDARPYVFNRIRPVPEGESEGWRSTTARGILGRVDEALAPYKDEA